MLRLFSAVMLIHGHHDTIQFRVEALDCLIFLPGFTSETSKLKQLQCVVSLIVSLVSPTALSTKFLNRSHSWFRNPSSRSSIVQITFSNKFTSFRTSTSSSVVCFFWQPSEHSHLLWIKALLLITFRLVMILWPTPVSLEKNLLCYYQHSPKNNAPVIK